MSHVLSNSIVLNDSCSGLFDFPLPPRITAQQSQLRHFLCGCTVAAGALATQSPSDDDDWESSELLEEAEWQ